MWLSKVIGYWNKSRHLAALKQQNFLGGHTRRMACRPRLLHLEPLEERTLLSVSMLNPIPFDPPTELIGPPGDSVETGTRTLVFDLFGGTWADAEKDATSTEDDLLCWAATASNILEYTGWGFVDGMTNTDQFLDYFEQHWTDEGTRTDKGLAWWFGGTDNPPDTSPWAHVDVAGGGFYTQLDVNAFMSTETNDADIMTFVDAQINVGSPVGLWVLNGFNHEITCWGFNYDPSETPGSTDYYLGVWITDSDDDKGVANGYTAPNDLHYYDVVWDAGDSRWEMPDYGNNSDLHILEAVSLQRYDAGIYAVNGDQDSVNQNDAIGVSLDATGNYLEIRINGNLLYNPLVSSVHELNIYGWGGNDTLTVDFTNGDPLAGLTLNYDGGAGGDDALEVIGSGSEIGSYLPAATAGDGGVQVGGSTINFTGLEPVLVSGFNEFTFVTPNSNDGLTIDSPAAGQNRISGVSGGVVFEALTFFDIDHFKIDTATNDNPLDDPNDEVTWSSDLVASGLNSFTVETGAGNDIVNATAVTSLGVTLLGGAGDDWLYGGAGNNWLEGGDGRDSLHGGDGNDTLLGGSGTDRLEGGLGSDTIDGGDGLDIYVFDGQGAGFDDRITVESYGTSVHISNTVPVSEMDALRDIEQLDIYTNDSLGTSPISDQVTINSLLGTGIEVVNFDGGMDNFNRLILNGTDAAETITVSNWVSGDGEVFGLGPVIKLNHFDGSFGDTLDINSLGGDDVIDGSALRLSDPPLYVFNGGDGDDTLIGGPADDALDGGLGNDTFIGNGGTDSVGGAIISDDGDTILVEGTPADDAITVSMVGGELQVYVNGNVTTYTETGGDMPAVERLLIETGDGDDVISTVPLPYIFTVVNAGPPAASDRLHVVVPGGASVTQGAVSTSGTISVGTSAREIDYTGLEQLYIDTDTAGSSLWVRATDDNDTLAMTKILFMDEEVQVQSTSISVNDGTEICFSNTLTEPDGFAQLNLEGRAGDDFFSIIPLDGVNIVVDGGDPTASDTAVVKGTGGSDTIIYTPQEDDAGLIEVNALGHVTVVSMESLVIDGLGGDDALTVRGTAGDDTFVHTPGAMVDAGGVMVNSLLPVAYEGLGADGSVTIDDAIDGGTDMLVYEGTHLDDIFEVSAGTGTVNLRTNPLLGVRQHVPLHQTNIEHLTLSGFDGDDLMVVNAPQPYNNIFLQGGGPGNSDLVQINGEAGVVDAVEVFLDEPNGNGAVTVNGVYMSYSGVENLHLLGNPTDADSLVINGTLAENQWEVERGSLLYGTRVQIDSREMIEYGEFSEIELRDAPIPIGGADVFRVHPAYIGDLTVTGTGEDVLQIIGTGGNDMAAVTTTQATLALTAVTYSGMVQLDVLTGSGDDALEVNVDAAFGSDLIGVPITFDGGEGSDGMMVSGAPSAGAAGATYIPGPAEGQGRLTHSDGVTEMTIDFLNLEPIVDLVPGPLLVLGTPAFNTINYEHGFATTMGRVTVDNFESIDFSLKTSLTIDAMAGNDVINLDNAFQPTGLIDIIVHGHSGDDTITLANLPASVPATVFGGSGNDLVDGSGVADAALNLNGQAGNDTLIGGGANDSLGGQAGDDMLIGNSGDNSYHGDIGFDTIGILGTLGNDRVDIHQTSATTLLSVVNGDTRNDEVIQVEAVRIELDRGDDIIRVMHDDSLVATPGDSLRIEVVGDAPNASDRLAVVDDGLGDVVAYRKAQDGRSGTITVGPLAPIVFEGIEYVDVTPLDQITSGTGTDGEGRLVVFKPDPFENNNTLPTATHLGSGTAINVDPTIDPGGDPGFGLPGDSDWYQFVAAETGTLDFQVYFEEIATLANGRAGLPGDGDLDILLFDSTGDFITSSSSIDDNERIRIPAVQGQIYYLQVYGYAGAINTYSMTIVNEPALAPYDIELDDAVIDGVPPEGSDTGRSNTDNVTHDNTPTLIFRLDDGFFLNDLPGNNTPDTPPDRVIPIPFQAGPSQPTTAGYAIAIFDEGPAPDSPPQTPLGFAMQIEPGVYTFTTPLLADGSHFLSARVQMIDPADPTQTGWGDRSLSLEIVVDTVAPPISFGEPAIPDDGLAPESDTGVSPPNQDTISDNVTSDTTPKFWGRAEADTIIRLYADTNGNGTLEVGADVFLGQDTAIPLDGNVQEPDGYWNIQSIVDLNDPAYFPVADGLRTIFVTAEDVAGNINAPDGAGDVLQIFIDTQGPVIDAVFITAEPGYDLFDPKPSTDGPTPLVGSISVTFTDPPPRVAPFLYPALKADVADQPGHYLLVGDANGVISIQSVIVVNDPVLPSQPATATVILTFFDPLPDDRFTLTVSDSLVDPVGNHLDGENNAIEPQETPLFPTGDGVPGGDFLARFTVDSRPEIGTWSAGSVYVDTNGNFYFDPTNTDATNRDLVYVYGFTSDNLFAGNFSAIGAATADGFDKLAAYGRVNGANEQYRWLIDTDNDGVPDIEMNDPANLNAQPVAGNFDGNAANGDEVGLFDGTQWWFDTNHDYIVDTSVASTITGYPIVGDFDGDGHDDLATYRDDMFYFQLWNGATYAGVQTIATLSLIGVRERPVAADVDQDGIDDIGLWAPDRSGATGDHIGEWYFLVSNDPAFDTSGNPLPQQRIAGQVNTLNHGFSPTPLGHDLFARFGNEYAMPIVGNFDPPVNAPAAPVNNGPAIHSVVTAVSGANPVITWTLDDADGIASTSIEIDGQSLPAYGPYGSNTHANYYRGLAGLNLAPGSHTFAIYATDSAGNPITTQYYGVFELPGSTNNGPAIYSVVTAVSGAKPVITWTLDDTDGIASTTLTVDGRTAVVYGPYGTKTHANFAGALAGLNLSAGSHTFVIHATDSAGTPVSTQYTGTFDVPAQAPANTGPAISSVVKAISGTKPVITWTLDDTDGIASTTLTVDGRTAAVYGPYGTKTHANFAGSLAALNLSAGSHTFVIHATDSAGTPVSSQYTGTFDVIAPANVGPAITNIVVTESGGNGDGVLQANEKVLITWSLTDPDGIASIGAFIDNVAAKAVYGPFGSNYSAVFDPWAAGSHTFSIRATDKSVDQIQTQFDAQFNVAVAQVMAQVATGSAKTNWLFNFI